MAGDKEPLIDSSKDWIFQTSSRWAQRVQEALTQPSLIHCCLERFRGTCWASAKVHRHEQNCACKPCAESQSWCVKVRKRRATGEDNAVTSCSALTGKQKHCTSSDWAVRLGLMCEPQCYLLSVFQAAFQVSLPSSLPPVPPQHFTESPLWEFVALV